MRRRARRRWTDEQWLDRFGVLVTVFTGLALIGLTMCSACNSDTIRDQINPPGPTLAPLGPTIGPTGVHP